MFQVLNYSKSPLEYIKVICSIFINLKPVTVCFDENVIYNIRNDNDKSLKMDHLKPVTVCSNEKADDNNY